MTDWPIKMDLAIYHGDGRVEVSIVTDGFPVLVVTIPAPMMTEIERQELIDKYRSGQWLNGTFIESERRVRNPLFDKGREKTTTNMTLRPCRTEDEAHFVASKIAEVVGCSYAIVDRAESAQEEK